jgi:hypothetical protein
VGQVVTVRVRCRLMAGVTSSRASKHTHRHTHVFSTPTCVSHWGLTISRSPGGLGWRSASARSCLNVAAVGNSTAARLSPAHAPTASPWGGVRACGSKTSLSCCVRAPAGSSVRQSVYPAGAPPHTLVPDVDRQRPLQALLGLQLLEYACGAVLDNMDE